MPTLDVFKADAFSVTSLTDAIIHAPYKPARIGELRLFGERPITTTTVQVEEKDGQLSLIPTSQRGAPAGTIAQPKGRVRAFTVPHLAREASIVADEIQNVRAFGSESEVEAVQPIVNDRLLTLRAMHEVTLEHLRIGALKGNILDADGVTVLFNLFTEFGVGQQTVDFQFSVGTTDIRARCVAVARAIEDALGAAVYTGIRVFCSSGWFDSLIGHAKVVESLVNQESILLRQDLRRGFQFGGLAFEEYRGSVGGVSFIEANVAYAFPEGVVTERGPLFSTYFAPADFMETVNTPGLPIYAKIAPDEKWNRYVDIHAQSNPLPLCLRPRAVVKLTKS